jgi:hypothetical protein
MQAQENVQLEASMPGENAEICEHCGNVYKIFWLKKGGDYNDFGFRHYTFCGFLVDELAHLGK